MENNIDNETKKVSNWWWLVIFFFSFIGGFIAWIVNKKEDPQKARLFLIGGFLVFLVSSGIMYFTFTTVREDVTALIATSNISRIAEIAEEKYEEEGTYINFDCSHNAETEVLCEEVALIAGSDLVINVSQENYCIYLAVSEKNFCANDANFIYHPITYPGDEGFCTQETFNCGE